MLSSSENDALRKEINASKKSVENGETVVSEARKRQTYFEQKNQEMKEKVYFVYLFIRSNVKSPLTLCIFRPYM